MLLKGTCALAIKLNLSRRIGLSSERVVTHGGRKALAAGLLFWWNRSPSQSDATGCRLQPNSLHRKGIVKGSLGVAASAFGREVRMPPKAKERLRVKFDDTGDGTWKPRYINGQEAPDWKKGPEMKEFIQNLIDEGWKPIIGLGDRYTFEREISSQDAA